MGTISKGILGGFSGKVGTVVGGSWKGIDYMRSKGNRSNNNPSEAQLSQQVKFSLSSRFLQSMSGLVELGFRNYAVKKTGINSALSYTLKNAITGSYPNFDISYGDVLVTRGDLPNALAPAAIADANSIVTFSWNNNSAVGVAKDTDKCILAAYCPALKQCVYVTNGTDRSSETDNLNLLSFKNQLVETYIGFISADGRNIATSIYTGQVTVL
jgi:hypothetical protein